jgi:hypothetical protein
MRWLIWCVFALFWTLGLVLPGVHPPGVGHTEQEIIWAKFFFAKSLHLVVYAVWAGYTGWLRPPLASRILLLFFMMSHAVATEIAQTFTPDREGCLRDVAIDHAGILLGLIATWNWWTRLEPPSAAEPVAVRKPSGSEETIRIAEKSDL